MNLILSSCHLVSNTFLVNNFLMNIRQATIADIESIIEFDHVAQVDEARRSYIAGAVEAESVWVFVMHKQVAGFVIIEYTFFGYGFVALLYTHTDYRRQGIGTALMQHVESICKTEKLFTSTNESNRAMHLLLAQIEFVPSGIINNLDEGDPEIIYYKPINHVLQS